jgi:hypothetical protein
MRNSVEIDPTATLAARLWCNAALAAIPLVDPFTSEEGLYVSRRTAVRDIRRRILEKGTPKKRVSAETGISRKTINKMLAHERPPGYRPRRRSYPKLAPYIHTIDRLLYDNNSFPLAVNMTIRDIVQHLRREEGFAGSYDSVRHYIRRRAHNDESTWARAYGLVTHLPKPRALVFIRHLSRGHPPAFASAQLRSFIREAACPRMPLARSRREAQRLLHIEWMRRVLQKESKEEVLRHELDDIEDLSILLQRLHTGRLLDRNRAMVALASRRKIPSRTICEFLGVGKTFVRNYRDKFDRKVAALLFAPQTRSNRKLDTTICGAQFLACFTNRQSITASIGPPGLWRSCAES